MHRKSGAVALLFFLSLSADANPGAIQVSQDQPLCGVCLELDNETLPDKHYFPSREEAAGDYRDLAAHLTRDEASALSAQIWTTESSHSGSDLSSAAPVARTSSYDRSDGKHGEPSTELADVRDTEWAWGGVRECSRGPEGKISAGCHAVPYDNLLCNSHYDECDDELFALAVAAVKNADAKVLRDLLAPPHTGHSTVLLNRKRGAIQLVGCTGDIVGNLPLDSALLRALQ